MHRFYQRFGGQLARPHGILGSLVMRHVLAVGNRALNDWAIDILAPRAGERVLDIGCGPGVGVARVSAQGCFVVGVDVSPAMVRTARRRIPRAAAGRAHLDYGDAGALPYADGAFDAAYTVNVMYFWDDAVATLREIRRVLRPGGRLMVALRPQATVESLHFSEIGFRSYSRLHLQHVLEAAGFGAVRFVADAPALSLPGWGALAIRA